MKPAATLVPGKLPIMPAPSRAKGRVWQIFIIVVLRKRVWQPVHRARASGLRQGRVGTGR
ncbi:hypothetical protein BR1R5_00180 [Pseudomonas sp. BR1R-5]|nr:hypothetical protein BR1R5_00180 [Pseudomonas sp. BR1R-5]